MPNPGLLPERWNMPVLQHTWRANLPVSIKIMIMITKIIKMIMIITMAHLKIKIMIMMIIKLIMIIMMARAESKLASE